MKYFIILMLTICCIFDLFTQSLLPTAADRAVWNMAAFHQINYEIIAEKDTSFCGYQWTKAVEQGWSLDGPRLLGYYRSEGRQVYYRYYADCSEREWLMYDYSLEPGDTVYLPINQSFPQFADTMRHVVYKVEQKVIEGLERKVLWISPDYSYGGGTDASPTIEWIEGIGSNLHPIPPAVCPLAGTLYALCEHGHHYVQCLQTQDGVLYRHPFDPYCSTLTIPVVFPDKDDLKISLSPNPAHQGALLNVQYQLPLAEDWRLLAYNVHGHLMETHRLPVRQDSGRFSLSTAGWPAGVYFVHLVNGKRRLRTMRVVME